MQLMWISESTGRIRRIPITLRTILMVVVCAALFFVGLGAVLNLIGFRVAIEQRPEIARAMGGVITVQQQQEVEGLYREKLGTLNEQVQLMATELAEVKKAKDKFAELATPKSLRSHLNVSNEGLGGPYKPIKLDAHKNDNFIETLDGANHDIKVILKNVADISHNWKKQIIWLGGLPSSIPISGDYKITSGYGKRIDPFTGGLAQHEGLDFSAQIGTLILASGDGVVYKVGFHKEYGNFVEIKHKSGYKTRYAHASELLVKDGQDIKRGDPIARVGSTGRSTGPHLHYEVMKDGGFFNSDAKLDPVGMLVMNNTK